MKAEIVFLLDMTGSMWKIKEDAIGGFNQFVQEQQKVDGEADMTLILFNSYKYNKLFEGRDIQHVPLLNEESYRPDHFTPLLDSLGRAINETDERIKKQDLKAEKVIFVVLTDGEENDSKEYSKQQVLDMVKDKQDNSKWEFIYLGANQDSFAEAGALGFRKANISNYAPTGQGVRSAYNISSSLTSTYRTGGGDASSH